MCAAAADADDGDDADTGADTDIDAFDAFDAFDAIIQVVVILLMDPGRTPCNPLQETVGIPIHPCARPPPGSTNMQALISMTSHHSNQHTVNRASKS